MARNKTKGTELSVFKGREAKLNRAILRILAHERPTVIYDITKFIRKQKGLKNTKYTNVSRRVKALEQQGYLEQAGSRDTQSGSQGKLYQITTRANLALVLEIISPNDFIKYADEESLMTELAALTSFLESKNMGSADQ